MKGVTKRFVAVRRADQFRQEQGAGDSDEERSGQQEESWVDSLAPSGEGERRGKLKASAKYYLCWNTSDSCFVEQQQA